MAYDKDKLLVRRLLSGDRQAFEQFFEDHFPPLYRLALARLGGSIPDAEEAAQGALCKAIAKLETYRAEAALGTWLATFCRHEIWAISQTRRRRAPEISLAEDTREIRVALESVAAICQDDPESQAHRSEIARLVQVALDQLPPHYGRALEWKYLQDITVKEIASRLKMTPKATESMLTRARIAFRDVFSTLIDVTQTERSRLQPARSETP